MFIDEIHRLARPAEEMLYLAMEDFRVDVVVGKGPGATAIPLDIAPFTLVGATTRAGLLPAPLRDRFGFTAHMDFYEPEDLQVIIQPVGRAARRDAARGRRGRDGRAVAAARRASPTGCCAGSVTTPRCAATAWSTAASPGPRWSCTRWTRRAWTGWTGPCCGALVRRFGGGPVGPVHAGRGGGGGGRDRRGGGRAVPGPPGSAGPYAARPGGYPGRLGAPGPHASRRHHRPRPGHPVRLKGR